jgi:hypothetical protein
LQAQTFRWKAGFDGFLDNREYYSIDIPKTIFGARVYGEVGASLEGGHRMMAGLNYLYEFGATPQENFPDVTLYYQYASDRVDFRIGTFPRRGVLEYPLALLSDTLLYYRPNVQGVRLAYRWDWGCQQVFIDWTSRLGETRPEQFLFGFSGWIERGVFFLDHHLLMGHLAGAIQPDPDHHLRDNGGFQARLGGNLSERTPLDSLRIALGALVSLDRRRGIDEGWQTPAGFVGELNLVYRWAGLDVFFYRGEGHTFVFGDPFYRLEQYGRLDIYVMPFRMKQVKLRFDVGMHFAEGQIDYSQQILLTMQIGNF